MAIDSKDQEPIKKKEVSPLDRRASSYDIMKKTIKKNKEADAKEGKVGLLEALTDRTIYRKTNISEFDDPFDSFYSTTSDGAAQIIEPPHNPSVLKRIPYENSILLQCIDTYVQNIEGTGGELVYVGPDELKDSQVSLAEKLKLESMIDRINPDYSLTELRSRTRKDQEVFGYKYIEFVREEKTGGILAAYHAPAHSIRMTKRDTVATEVTQTLKRNGKDVAITRPLYFRRYVQLTHLNNKVYFKEFGDPRRISSKTGNVMSEGDADREATEILMISSYKPGSLYGVPRWINQIPSILGSRENEIVNLNFFKDNAIPALAILVAGGFLSQEAVEALTNKVMQGRGSERMNMPLILEATSDEVSVGPNGTPAVPKIEMKAMSNDRQNDMMFESYDKNCQAKIRSSFRLPPVLLGLSEDYTYATANASMVVCESQVFQPEREAIDGIINRYILGDGVNENQFWAYKSHPTRVVDKQEVINSLEVLDKVGALTPNDAITVANSMFGLSINQIDDEWGNYPYSMALEMVKKGEQLKGLESMVALSTVPDAVTPDKNLLGSLQTSAKKFIKAATGGN